MCTCDCPNIDRHLSADHERMHRRSLFQTSRTLHKCLALHDDTVLYLAYLPWMPERGNKLPRACGW